MRRITLGSMALLVCTGMFPLPAQTELTGTELEALRTAKEAGLKPEERPRLERGIVRAQNSFVYRGLTNQLEGFGFGIGQLVPGAGFSIGPQYVRSDLLDGKLGLRVSARVSTKEYYAARLQL